MVSTKEIESLGWKHASTAKNGGSKTFYLNNFTLFSHADNFILKNNNELTIKSYTSDDYTISNQIFTGPISNIDGLIDVMVKWNIDIPLTRDHKIDQIIN